MEATEGEALEDDNDVFSSHHSSTSPVRTKVDTMYEILQRVKQAEMQGEEVETMDQLERMQSQGVSEQSSDENEIQPQKSVMPLVRSGYSMKPDMMFGWRPDTQPVSGAPIPLYYEYEMFEEPEELLSGLMKVIFYGKRYPDTHKLHRAFSDKRPCEALPNVGYNFTFPPVGIPFPNIERTEDPPPFDGMRPDMKHALVFDSDFESGNLDMVV